MLAEPAFSCATAWPAPGPGGLPPEPDDPRPALVRDTLLAERQFPPAGWLAGSADLDRPADEPLQIAKPAAPARRSAWKAAIAASCLLHAAVALAFLAGKVDTVEIAGTDQTGVMLLGNALADQSSAGDGVEATNVTLVTMPDPKPAETIKAEPVAETDAVRAVEETVQPKPFKPEPERVAEAPAPVTPSPAGNATENATGVPPAPAAPTPEVLTAQTGEPAQEAVVPHVGPQARPMGLLPTERPDTIAVEKAPSAEAATADSAPVPQPRPVRPKRSTEEKPAKKQDKEPARKTGKKIAAERNPAERAEKADTGRKKAGSSGASAADSRRGAADGQADGRRQVAGKGGTASAAGNAAASNYPGKVAAKLRRAVRGIARGGRARADVLVSFTVNAGGGLGGVRIARSSGSPDLDRMALAIVRRAAPFPPIPVETGRGSWAFTLPLGVR